MTKKTLYIYMRVINSPTKIIMEGFYMIPTISSLFFEPDVNKRKAAIDAIIDNTKINNLLNNSAMEYRFYRDLQHTLYAPIASKFGSPFWDWLSDMHCNLEMDLSTGSVNLDTDMFNESVANFIKDYYRQKLYIYFEVEV